MLEQLGKLFILLGVMSVINRNIILIYSVNTVLQNEQPTLLSLILRGVLTH